MRKLTALLLFICASAAYPQAVITSNRLVTSGGGGGTPSILQSETSTTDGVFSAALPSHAAGGESCVLAELSTAGSSGAPTLSNTANWWVNSAPDASYTLDPGSTGYQFFAWCHATSTDASSDAATVTSTAYHGGIAFIDISVVSHGISGSQGNGSASYSTATTGSFSLTGTPAMACGLYRGGGGGAIPTGYTSLTASGTGFWNNDAYHSISCKAVTGTSLNITWNGADNPWAVFGVAVY